MMKEKKYKSISEVSNLLQLKPHIIRYWDSKFPGVSTRLQDNKSRFFNKENIKRLEQIKNILYANGHHNYSLEIVNKLLNKKIVNDINHLHQKNEFQNKKISLNFENLENLKKIRKNLSKLLI